MPTRPRVHYLILERNVLSDGIGGKAHIEGVLRALLADCDVTLVGADLHLLGSAARDCTLVEVPASQGARRFYAAMLRYVRGVREPDGFLYRKTLVGLVVSVLAVLLARLGGRGQCHIVEMNGISGDFRQGSPWRDWVLRVLNAWLVRPFDGVYCVNENIAARLLATRVVRPSAVFVGENGGFGPLLSAEDIRRSEGDAIHMVFYGARQAHYAIEEFLDAVRRSAGTGGHAAVTVHLVGSGFEGLAGKQVVTPGPLNRAGFAAYVQALRGRVWGLLPLRNVGTNTDVRPIKLLDYISCGLPVIASYLPRDLAVLPSPVVIQYRLGDARSLKAALTQVEAVDIQMLNEARGRVLELAKRWDWQQTLSPLRARFHALV